MADPDWSKDIFRDKEYSDITIKFSGREIPCHKVVICTQSEYFKKLCGEGSQFSESKQKVVKLKRDDPEAVEAIILIDNDWKFHAEVVKVANKYLIPKAADLAAATLMKLLNGLRASSAVCHAILEIRSHYANDEALVKKATELQDKHIDDLLLQPRFVDSLTNEEICTHFDRFQRMFAGAFEHCGEVCDICGSVQTKCGRGSSDCLGKFDHITTPTKYLVVMPGKH
ncbi:hypothetical protein CERZMDRAFT_88214 [Cercospora zeae-maydis SCOH1-5]|uniref:BTB domain-containing protein n=1 Tax=Cercospora zeae-maydis SCOH1-5 TaxID=717836 RepID=A0A6A6EZU8_9PEZI|nr:hypothetical protein CERZMDRAFT_88214 [Cercospora zeae-maydis SCOH1-5]